MTMRSLKAIKSHKYGTRQLTAGEEYEAPVRHAFALVASKKARFADKPTPRAAVAKPAAEQISAPQEGAPIEATIDELRLQATQLGIDVDGRWGAARLQHEIAQARQR
jgi:hypothetical protein